MYLLEFKYPIIVIYNLKLGNFVIILANFLWGKSLVLQF